MKETIWVGLWAGVFLLLYIWAVKMFTGSTIDI